MLVAVAKHDHVLSSLEAQHLLSTIHRYRKMRLKPNTPSTQPRRLVGYARVSTEDQANDAQVEN
jgi:predicted site-specific integrase-resolvase